MLYHFFFPNKAQVLSRFSSKIELLQNISSFFKSFPFFIIILMYTVINRKVSGFRKSILWNLACSSFILNTWAWIVLIIIRNRWKMNTLLFCKQECSGALCSGVCDVYAYQLIDFVGRFACFRLQGLGLVFNKQVFENQEIQL